MFKSHTVLSIELCLKDVMMLSSVCVSRMYYHNERNKNAGTGNFVFVGEYTVLCEYCPRFLKNVQNPI